ncbi:gem-associated protein 5-like [Anthonomus grandis grandis]|uniref:gem-associated protein 5-like n=1 Tax=Anthonomus grandis grandis TaxID=2921223 RepID=UPI00216620AA|nr:gem-associated protein 5-like [Anthonomus grandis grandis]XP_050309809.1 gem-associated protein 5-like [Anthonomus grandis grandis]XP_050309810.1 gem-associated protein 5-like [Anthonomus grandis grandis]
MNKLLIPSSPNWFLSDILACAPDNTVICGSRQDLVIIKPTEDNIPDDICCIGKAHSTKIISVGINRNWGQPHKYAVSLSENAIIKLWDIETLEKKSSHNRHFFTDTKSKVIGACFAGDDRIISAEDTGTIIVWNFIKHETNVIKSLFSKITLTCLSVCPFATWLVAFGLKSGLVIVTDLRKTGKILYTLRGHAKEVISLAWCPAPVNVFPLKPNNKVVEKQQAHLELKEESSSVNHSQMDIKSPENSDENELFFSPKAFPNENRRKQKSPKKEPLAEVEPLPIDGFQKAKSGDVVSPKHLAKRNEFKLDNLLMKTPDNDKSTIKKVECQIIEHPISGASNLDNSASGDESKPFSSASSCGNSTCSKKSEAFFTPGESEGAGNLSDTNEVFHDATNAIVKDVDKGDSEEHVENWRVKEAYVEPEEEEPRKEFLLASSAREPNIYIWRAGTDGRMQTFLTVPNRPMPKKQKSSSDKLWITLCWVTPTKLLSSSRNADLLLWTLPRPMVQAKFVRKIHRDHWSVLFSIKAPIVYLNEYNFLQSRELNAWTTGMDRQLINTNIDNLKKLACYPAFGGSINCLVGSPLDPNRLAIGTGEGVVNVWDLSRNETKNISFSTFYLKILSSVTALAWHPSIESSLAWGTTEGRIGIQDVTNKSKGPKVLPHFFKSQIFKLEWGPSTDNPKSRKLFAVSESKIAIFDIATNEKVDPVLLDLPDDTSVYTMAWKPDYSMLLVSSKTGTLISYTPELLISDITYNTHKIQSIIWHPDAASDDASESKYCKTFVSVIKNSEFAVFDLNVPIKDVIKTTTFENRGARINDIAWSPYNGSQLVVADDAGVAQIYDIETKVLLSTYMNPTLDPLLSVHWSPVDSDYVIVGTQAHRLAIWKISENPPLEEKVLTSQRNKISKAQQKEVSDQLIKEKEEPIVPPAELKKPATEKIQLAPLFYAMKNNPVTDLEKLLDFKLGKLATESPICDNDATVDILDVFGNSGDMVKVFNLNQRTLRKQGKHRQGNILALFQGDISTVVKEAIEQRRVDPWIISFCPMVSPKLWQSACETYVSQLLEEPEADPMEIVMYQLACHQVEEAVKVLCDHHLYREAYLLAKGRFGGESPIVIDVMRQWAKNNVLVGCFELAAACYISLGNYEEAATVLYRRSNVQVLELAKRLAKLCDNQELQKAVTFRLDAFKTVRTENENASKPDICQNNDKSKEENEETQKGQGDESLERTDIEENSLKSYNLNTSNIPNDQKDQIPQIENVENSESENIYEDKTVSVSDSSKDNSKTIDVKIEEANQTQEVVTLNGAEVKGVNEH